MIVQETWLYYINGRFVIQMKRHLPQVHLFMSLFLLSICFFRWTLLKFVYHDDVWLIKEWNIKKYLKYMIQWQCTAFKQYTHLCELEV